LDHRAAVVPAVGLRGESLSRRASVRRRHLRLRALCLRLRGRVRVGGVERFGGEQRPGERLELVAVVGEQPGDLGVGFVDDPTNLLVDQPLGLRGGLGGAWEQVVAGAFARQQRERPELVAHPPAADHLAGDLGQLLDVGLGAGGDLAVDDLLGDPTAEGDADLRLQVLSRVRDAVGIGG